MRKLKVLIVDSLEPEAVGKEIKEILESLNIDCEIHSTHYYELAIGRMEKEKELFDIISVCDFLGVILDDQVSYFLKTAFGLNPETIIFFLSVELNTGYIRFFKDHGVNLIYEKNYNPSSKMINPRDTNSIKEAIIKTGVTSF